MCLLSGLCFVIIPQKRNNFNQAWKFMSLGVFVLVHLLIVSNYHTCLLIMSDIYGMDTIV